MPCRREGRTRRQPPYPDYERLALRQPLRLENGHQVYAEVQYRNTNTIIRVYYCSGICFDEDRWSVGLVLENTGNLSVKSSLKECLMAMRNVQAAREERDNVKDATVYGLTTSGDIIQFHKLTESRKQDLQSSPVFLITEDGLPGLWPYLANIIHDIQRVALPPRNTEREWYRPPEAEHELDAQYLMYRYGYSPDGKMVLPDHRDPSLTEEARREAKKKRDRIRRQMQWLHLIHDVESDCDIPAGDDSDSGGGGDCWLGYEPQDEDLSLRDAKKCAREESLRQDSRGGKKPVVKTISRKVSDAVSDDFVMVRNSKVRNSRARHMQFDG